MDSKVKLKVAELALKKLMNGQTKYLTSSPAPLHNYTCMFKFCIKHVMTKLLMLPYIWLTAILHLKMLFSLQHSNQAFNVETIIIRPVHDISVYVCAFLFYHVLCMRVAKTLM